MKLLHHFFRFGLNMPDGRSVLVMVLALHGSLASQAQTSPQRDSLPPTMRPKINLKGFSLRAGVGIHRSFYYELGVAYTYFVASPHSGGGYNIYAAYTSFPAFRRPERTISGFRFGADFHGQFGFAGLEVIPLRGEGVRDVLIAPKYGVGVPTTGFYYAYHFSTNNRALARVGRHQIGLQVSPYIWQHDKLKAEKRWFWMQRKGRQTQAG